jgi:hypothetical protein
MATHHENERKIGNPTVKVKVSEAGNAALNWAAAIALGWVDVQITAYDDPDSEEELFFRPAKVIGGREV